MVGQGGGGQNVGGWLCGGSVKWEEDGGVLEEAVSGGRVVCGARLRRVGARWPFVSQFY